jgi:hypothetical protein
MVASSVGEGTAVEFKSFAKTYGSLPNIDDILKGKDIQISKDKPDILCALSSALVARAGKATDEQLQNIMKFIMNSGMSKEFSVLTVKDLLRVDNLKIRLISLPEWNEWSKSHKQFIM